MREFKEIIIALAVVLLAALAAGCEKKADAPSIGKVRMGEGHLGDNLKEVTPQTGEALLIYEYTPFFNKEIFEKNSWKDSDSVEVRVEIVFSAPGGFKNIKIEGAKVGGKDDWLLENEEGKEIVFDSPNTHVEHWVVKPREQKADGVLHEASFTVIVADGEGQTATADIKIDFGPDFYMFKEQVWALNSQVMWFYSHEYNETFGYTDIALGLYEESDIDFALLYDNNNKATVAQWAPSGNNSRFLKLENVDKNKPDEWWNREPENISSVSQGEEEFNEGDLFLFRTDSGSKGAFFIHKASDTEITIHLIKRSETEPEKPEKPENNE